MKRFFASFILIAALGGSTSHALDECEDSFAPEINYVDPKSPRAVLVGGFLPAPMAIHRQVFSALPNGVKPITMTKAMSVWVRDWFPLVIKDRETREWKIIQFEAQTPHGRIAAWQANRFFVRHGFKVSQADVFFDWGNSVSDGQRIFISKSQPLLKMNSRWKGIHPDEFKSRIELATGKRVVWVPELPREGTGHADMFMTYVGGDTVLVADSRDADRKKMLDETDALLAREGFKVVRIRNAGLDSDRSALSYTNSLIIGNRVLLPMYSPYVKKDFMAVGRKVFWEAFDSLFDSKLAKSKLAGIQKNLEQIAADDEAAIEIYRGLGFDVVPIFMNGTVKLDGMVHCLTRCLPQGALEQIPDSSW